MLLDATTKSLEIYLGGAVATNQLPVVSFYADHTPTSLVPGSSDTQTNGVTPVTFVAAPASSTQRQIKAANIYNADTASVTIYIRLNNNSTYRTLIKVTLQPGEQLRYSDSNDWTVRSSDGFTKSGGTFVRVAPLVSSLVKDAANLTAVTAFATGVCQCHYMGVAPFATSSISLLANITTAAITITWAEVAIYRGIPVLNGGCQDLTRLGYLDVAATYNATGIKNNPIALTIPANPGDNIWVVMGSAATTMFQMRGALADNIQSGLFNTLTARPSLTAGPTSGTIASASLVPAWIAIKYN